MTSTIKYFHLNAFVLTFCCVKDFLNLALICSLTGAMHLPVGVQYYCSHVKSFVLWYVEILTHALILVIDVQWCYLRVI